MLVRQTVLLYIYDILIVHTHIICIYIYVCMYIRLYVCIIGKERIQAMLVRQTMLLQEEDLTPQVALLEALHHAARPKVVQCLCIYIYVYVYMYMCIYVYIYIIYIYI
jgi:hypothetical protein